MQDYLEFYPTRIRATGPWFLCVQKVESGFGTFYGVKLWGLAFYVRWNLPKGTR